MKTRARHYYNSTQQQTGLSHYYQQRLGKKAAPAATAGRGAARGASVNDCRLARRMTSPLGSSASGTRGAEHRSSSSTVEWTSIHCTPESRIAARNIKSKTAANTTSRGGNVPATQKAGAGGPGKPPVLCTAHRPGSECLLANGHATATASSIVDTKQEHLAAKRRRVQNNGFSRSPPKQNAASGELG